LEALLEAERAIVAGAADLADRHRAATTASAAISSSGGSLKSLAVPPLITAPTFGAA